MIPISKPLIGDEEIRAVSEVLRSGMLAQGSRVAEFEKRFASYVGTSHGVAVSNGTAALYVALLAMGLGPGDEVVTTSLSFFATASTILLTGAKPVFVDIDPETYNLDPREVEAALSESTKAILPVHLFGHPADMDPIMKLAEERGLLVLEDAAQAHGAEYKGRRVGSIGHAATFSFYPTKNMTTAEGGIITSDDESIAKRARLLRDHGQESKYVHILLGFNLRMTDVQASVGLVQLDKLERMNERRRRIARTYIEELSGLDGLEVPVEKPWAKHAWHLFPLRAVKVNRDRLIEAIRQRGVDARPSYPSPIYDQPVMANLGKKEVDPLWFARSGEAFRKRDCPNAERLVREILLIPIHPGLSEEDVETVVRAVKEAYSEIA
ncbi:MAG TPA: DegT/DnrJ/EryC1/StrS family aminotransferase [Candidatus Korarchaeota archaeon]|nr:DegT/DnrJ/EryC1/StrS family aminotransferase [Candidatus Korarchaeota archaeon]